MLATVFSRLCWQPEVTTGEMECPSKPESDDEIELRDRAQSSQQGLCATGCSFFNPTSSLNLDSFQNISMAGQARDRMAKMPVWVNSPLHAGLSLTQPAWYSFTFVVLPSSKTSNGTTALYLKHHGQTRKRCRTSVSTRGTGLESTRRQQ